MTPVRKYQFAPHAEQAAAWLRTHGIPAEVVGDRVQGAMGLPTLQWAQLQVVVLYKEHAEAAAGLLAELDAESEAAVDDLEASATPDLSRLVGALPPPCPECEAPLPMDARLRACPACGAGVSVADLLVARDGPEALIAAYDGDASPEADREMPFLASRGAACTACGYSLEGHGDRGRCPECGQLFDQAAMKRRSGR